MFLNFLEVFNVFETNLEATDVLKKFGSDQCFENLEAIDVFRN